MFKLYQKHLFLQHLGSITSAKGQKLEEKGFLWQSENLSNCTIHRTLMNNYMPRISRSCNVKKGYFLHDDAESQMAIGYLSSLSFPSAKISLKNDISTANPENPTAPQKVCAVLSYIEWDGKPESPLSFACTLSFANKALICEALSSLSENRLCVEWALYDYDYQERQYFKYFYTEMPLQLTFDQNSRLEPDDDKYGSMNNPVVFTFHLLSLMPDPNLLQKIGLAFRANGKQFIRTIGGAALLEAQHEKDFLE